jgi:hypothetical protein
MRRGRRRKVDWVDDAVPAGRQIHGQARPATTLLRGWLLRWPATLRPASSDGLPADR